MGNSNLAMNVLLTAPPWRRSDSGGIQVDTLDTPLMDNGSNGKAVLLSLIVSPAVAWIAMTFVESVMTETGMRRSAQLCRETLEVTRRDSILNCSEILISVGQPLSPGPYESAPPVWPSVDVEMRRFCHP
jgi:hypothetical protein